MSRSVVLEAPGRWRLVETDPPEPGPGEAVVRVAAAGVCGSDRELHAGSRPAGFAAYPVTPGHEWSGTVAAVGAGVDPALVAAPVVGEGFRACLACDACRTGATNLCTAGYDETGFTQPGGFADHLLLPARLLHTLPPGAELRAAALLEPAAVVAAAVRRAGLRPGESAAVIGAGTLGILTLQFLAAASPGALCALDTRPERADPAMAAGAGTFVTAGAAAGGPASGSAAGPAVGSTAGSAGGSTDELRESFDVVIETAGAAGTAHTAVDLVRRGGRVVITGIPGDTADAIPTTLLVTRNLTLSSVFGAASGDWAYAVRAFATGVLNPATLITHELPLADYAAALELSASADAGKVLLRP